MIPVNRPSSIPTGIGPTRDIEGAIIDKNVRIGEGVLSVRFRAN